MNTGFAIFVSSLTEGCIPLVRDEHNRPVIFATEREAQLEIVDALVTKLREFQGGERDFDDATTIDEFVVAVRAHPDGSIEDEFGQRFR